MRLLVRSIPRAVSIPKRFPSSTPLSIQKRLIATHTDVHHEAAVSVIRSSVDTGSPEFKENEREMREVTSKLKELHEKIKLGGPEKAKVKHVERGKMLPRE